MRQSIIILLTLMLTVLDWNLLDGGCWGVNGIFLDNAEFPPTPRRHRPHQRRRLFNPKIGNGFHGVTPVSGQFGGVENPPKVNISLLASIITSDPRSEVPWTTTVELTEESTAEATTTTTPLKTTEVPTTTTTKASTAMTTSAKIFQIETTRTIMAAADKPPDFCGGLGSQEQCCSRCTQMGCRGCDCITHFCDCSHCLIGDNHSFSSFVKK